MAKFKAETVHLHQAYLIHGYGATDVLDPKKMPGIQVMVEPGIGVWVEFKSRKYYIPIGNLTGAWYKEESTEEPKKKTA